MLGHLRAETRDESVVCDGWFEPGKVKVGARPYEAGVVDKYLVAVEG